MSANRFEQPVGESLEPGGELERESSDPAHLHTEPGIGYRLRS